MNAWADLTEEQKTRAVRAAKTWAQDNADRRKEIARAYYHRHKAEILAAARAKTAANPKPRPAPKGRDPVKAKIRRQEWENRNCEKKNARHRLWREQNKERALANEAQYRIDNRERLNKRNREWAKTHHETYSVYCRNRRARKRAAEGSHTADDIARLREVQRDRCAVCRAKLNKKGHVDHIIALSKGGSNWPNNLQLLCESCNCSKHSRDPIEFMRSRGRLL